jgi:predicted transposase/invertase (TIGR01784 family)
METLSNRSRSEQELKRLLKKSAAEGKPLSVMDDEVFKAMLTSDTDDSREALRSLLSACIHRKIAHVQVNHTELVVDHLDAKTVRLDVNVTFDDGESANLEMQKRNSKDNIKDRAATLTAMLQALQSRRGKPYEDIKRVYQIFFLNFNLKPPSNKLPRKYSYYEETEHDRLTEMSEILFYEMPKLGKKVRQLLKGTIDMDSLSEEEKWCIYMKYRHEERAVEQIEQLCRKEEGIMHAEQAVNKISRDYLKAIREMNIRKNNMDRAQRIRNQENKARAEGLAEGRAEGRTEGLEEGKREIARKMKEAGISFEQIHAITGLSFETIEQM